MFCPFQNLQFISFFFLEKFIHSLIYPFNTTDRRMQIYYVLGTFTSTKQNRTNICSHGAYSLRVVLNPSCKEQFLEILIYLGRKQGARNQGGTTEVNFRQSPEGSFNDSRKSKVHASSSMEVSRGSAGITGKFFDDCLFPQ